MQLSNELWTSLKPILLAGLELLRDSEELHSMRSNPAILDELQQLGITSDMLMFFRETARITCYNCKEPIVAACPRSMCRKCGKVNNILTETSGRICNDCAAKRKGECVEPGTIKSDVIHHKIRNTSNGG